jgi:microsomal dipeptidase-like Zn-dependent dipeptidase
MSNPVFFDLHCHPGLKSYLTASREKDRISCWQLIDVRGPFGFVDRFFKGNMLDSSSSLSQLKKGNVSIAVVGLYAYERTMIKSILTKFQDTAILNRFRIKQLDYNLLRKLASKKSNYFRLFKGVQRHLLKAKRLQPEYNLVKKFSDFVPDKLNVVLSIEGGHNLFSRKPYRNDGKRVMRNLSKLKTGKRRYFFFGPAHLERNPLCTHAFGMKIIDDEKFNPDGDAYGISNLGKRVIKKALENPHRILIDIKHMSLVSRLQYYDMLQNNDLGEVPIIMSHAGVTGVSYNSMPIDKCELTGKWFKVRYYKPAGLRHTAFNPWSINLYDEEIPVIIASNGIIGMNLDERILGTKQHSGKERTEYFSRKDFEDYWDQVPEDNSTNNQSRRYRRNNCNRWYMYHGDVKHLCNNILHIVKIGGPKAWDHICIGSDYDGMINGVDPYNDAEKLMRLRKHLIKWLPRMAKSDRNHSYFINDENIEKRVDAIMFENAYRFLKENFS